jgi:hypothetical protein
MREGRPQMKKVYEVEFKGVKQKYYFDQKEQAQDFGIIQGVFGGKKYKIQEIFVEEK